jgi:hypothetical protein
MDTERRPFVEVVSMQVKSEHYRYGSLVLTNPLSCRNGRRSLQCHLPCPLLRFFAMVPFPRETKVVGEI